MIFTDDLEIWGQTFFNMSTPELSTGRMDPRVGSGRVTIFPDFGGSGRVGSALWIF